MWSSGVCIMGYCMDRSVNWSSMGISKMCINIISILMASVVCWSSVVYWSSMVVIKFSMTVLRMLRFSMVVASLPVMVWGFMLSVLSMKFVISHISMVVAMVIIVVIHWLHLQNQVTARSVNIGWVENRGVCLKST